MNEMTTYAASLTGAKGRVLEAETITVGPKTLAKLVEEKPDKPAAKSKKEHAHHEASKGGKGAGAKKGTKAAAAGLSKKDQMIADNKERKGGTEADKAFTAWMTVMKGNLDVISDDQDRYLKTIEYLNGLDSSKSSILEAEIYTYILQSLLNWWYSYCKAGKNSEGYFVVALIWTTVRSIATSNSAISVDIVLHVQKICTLLGILNAVQDMKPSSLERKLSFTFKYPTQAQSLKIEIPQTDFQLNYCGPYMDRMLDAKPDARVSSFVPDGWQRDVLDQLDICGSSYFSWKDVYQFLCHGAGSSGRK
jgi:hypothetical protein